MLKCLFRYGILSILACLLIYSDGNNHQYTNQFVVWWNETDNVIPEGVLTGNFTIEKLNISDEDCLYLVTDTFKPKGIRSVTPDTDTVERLRAQPKVKKAEQQEYKVRVTKTADSQWQNLWYLNGAISPSMKVQEAWNLGYNGSGVTIAVVDQGVEITHTDLDANMYSGYHYDYVNNDADPDPRDGKDVVWRDIVSLSAARNYTTRQHYGRNVPSREGYNSIIDPVEYKAELILSHGTRCAGLIVSEANNNECVVGVAYGARVIGVRLLSSDGTTDLQESKSLNHQRSIVDIYTNSWGPTDGYGYSDSGSLVKTALLSGISSGRSGKGAIFTWAAGNGYKDDNCNADGYVNSIYTIGVTSLDSTGKPASYSEVCAAAMATTYGGSSASRYLYSTGYSGSCASNLQGTSFATPVAAGIIALALQANPNLNWRDVQHLIVLTSKKHSLSDRYYSWQLNGAKKYVHPRLGFGLMDAEDMVKYAATWTQVPTQITFESSTSNPNLSIDIFDTTEVTDSITIGSGCSVKYLEHVQVQIYFQSQSIGHVELTLTSPSGTKSYLMTQRPAEYNFRETLTWTFMTLHHWGEAPKGQWTLKMAVNGKFYAGNLYAWKLIQYGTQTDPLPYLDVCSGSPCALGKNCTGNNYEYECDSDGSNGHSSNDSTPTAVIVGVVIACIALLCIAVAIRIKVTLRSATKVAPATRDIQ